MNSPIDYYGGGWELALLLERHPDSVRKIGDGIDYFYVAMTGAGTPAFHFKRTDGSVEHFSFYTAVKGQDPTPKSQVTTALRNSMRAELSNQKAEYIRSNIKDGLVECHVRGDWIDPADAQLDHAEPMTFEAIVEHFVRGHLELHYDEIVLAPKRDGQYGSHIADEALLNEFAKYHNRVARLRLIHKDENLSSGPKRRIKKSRVPLTSAQSSFDF